MNEKADKLLMPSNIVIKDGLACGDKIILLYDFENTVMQFEMISYGCIYSRKICEVLQDKYNCCASEYINDRCIDLLRQLSGNPEYAEEIMGLPYKSSRSECYLAPIRILKASAEENKKQHHPSKCGINLNVDKMDCDACAIRENVSWLYKKASHVHGHYNITQIKREMLMKLGKLSINSISTNDIKELYDSLEEDDFLFMEEHKLFPMVYHNLMKMGIISNHDSRWRLLIYQRQRTVMAYTEIAKLTQFIKQNNLKAFWIKGAVTSGFYKEPAMRNLTDFDLLATDETDAFRVIEWLIGNGYGIFPDSFSLKRTREKEESIYTGHLHFQKIINLQYRLIIDINFTGFPMIRVASYIPSFQDGMLTIESMIVITLCHLFKHKEVFMKDINDLFLMLTSEQMSGDTLYRELQNHGLLDLFAIVIDFINKEYDVPIDAEEFISISNRVLCNKEAEYRNWPYSVEDVIAVKSKEFEKYAKDVVEFERIYLYPVLIFEGLYDVDKLDLCIRTCKEIVITERTKMTNKLTQYKIDDFYFVLSPIGWFLEMKDYYKESMKPSIRNILKKIISMLEINLVDIPYAIAFEDKWLDTDRE